MANGQSVLRAREIQRDSDGLGPALTSPPCAQTCCARGRGGAAPDGRGSSRRWGRGRRRGARSRTGRATPASSASGALPRAPRPLGPRASLRPSRAHTAPTRRVAGRRGRG
eukprot:2571593-Prymnesium_polylepis.1